MAKSNVLIGTHYPQDVDLDKLYMDVAAYNQRVTGPGHVVNMVDEATKNALSYRTVTHITIPKDVQHGWKILKTAMKEKIWEVA